MPIFPQRAAAAVMLAAAAAAASASGQTVVYTEKSKFENIVVYESDGERCMKFGSIDAPGRQSCQSLAHPDTLLFEYTKMMLGSLYLKPDPHNILVIGLGGGSLPRALAEVLPETRIDCVEIDPAVVSVAQRYFGLKTGPRLRVFTDDGRDFVRQAAARGEKYDIVMLDAFDENYIPRRLMTREFLQEVGRILSDDGVLAANTFTASRQYADESATYASVFGVFYNLRGNNRVILAKKDGLPPPSLLKRRAREWAPRLEPLGVDADRLLPMFSTRQDWPYAARVLKD
ncbi:hypothetical protein GCM10023144_41040 [Pigmentiphaga soli]|uniref:Polyamine aminopropyltransferase n=1 Tax=Pigmentiphaga soli TaxID=1007095 RepID=A0ABP8HLA6_9BURK